MNSIVSRFGWKHPLNKSTFITYIFSSYTVPFMVVLWPLFQHDDARQWIHPTKKGIELEVMPRHIWPPEVAAKNQILQNKHAFMTKDESTYMNPIGPHFQCWRLEIVFALYFTFSGCRRFNPMLFRLIQGRNLCKCCHIKVYQSS